MNNDIIKIETYSENETDTGMTWIDGKTIYRKVVVVTTNFQDPITIQNIDTPIDYRGIAYGDGFINIIPYPAVASSAESVSQAIYNWQASGYFNQTIQKRFEPLFGNNAQGLTRLLKIIWIFKYTKTTN